MNTIFILEQDFLFLDLLVELLNEQGFITIASQNEQMGLQLAGNHSPDLIIWDVTKTGLNGYKWWSTRLKTSVAREIPCIFLTSEGTDRTYLNASELKADDCLSESCTVEDLIAAIEIQLARSKQVA